MLVEVDGAWRWMGRAEQSFQAEFGCTVDVVVEWVLLRVSVSWRLYLVLEVTYVECGQSVNGLERLENP